MQFDYALISDYAERCELDGIETLMLIREIAAKVKEK